MMMVVTILMEGGRRRRRRWMHGRRGWKRRKRGSMRNMDMFCFLGTGIICVCRFRQPPEPVCRSQPTPMRRERLLRFG
jgi:hypothetical protein